MNDCAETQTRVCKAYVADCYGRLAESYNKCKPEERYILKKNIFDMLDRIKLLLDKDNKIENNSAVNAD